MDDALFALAFCFIAVTLLAPMALCRRWAPEEKGLAPLYEDVCTGVVGLLRVGIPCIRLSIYDGFFVMSVAGLKPKVLAIDKEVSASKKKWVFSSQLQIYVRSGTTYCLAAKKIDEAVRLLRTAHH